MDTNILLYTPHRRNKWPVKSVKISCRMGSSSVQTALEQVPGLLRRKTCHWRWRHCRSGMECQGSSGWCNMWHLQIHQCPTVQQPWNSHSIHFHSIYIYINWFYWLLQFMAFPMNQQRFATLLTWEKWPAYLTRGAACAWWIFAPKACPEQMAWPSQGLNSLNIGHAIYGPVER